MDCKIELLDESALPLALDSIYMVYFCFDERDVPVMGLRTKAEAEAFWRKVCHSSNEFCEFVIRAVPVRHDSTLLEELSRGEAAEAAETHVTSDGFLISAAVDGGCASQLGRG